MIRELIIRSLDSGLEIALLENQQLVEFHKETEELNLNVGDIFLARIKKMNPSLNAAFVDVGFKKDGFLHYSDLGPNIKSLEKFTSQAINGTIGNSLQKFKLEKAAFQEGKINNVISKKHPLLLQVLKEPISQKGPRLTADISIPGRMLVLAPFQNSVGISRKISNPKNRKRILNAIESIRPKNMGIVVRTAAEHAEVDDLQADLNNLMEKWKLLVASCKKSSAPKKVLSEGSRIKTLLRDLFNDSFSRILVSDKDLSNEIVNMVEEIAPGNGKIVQHYNRKEPIFDYYNITHQIKSLFGKKVSLPSGGYLIIEHTEAMHVIDVNSGQKGSEAQSNEENARLVNLEAAREIARQLRLRDLGGLVTIDFIDIKGGENKQELVKEVRDSMKLDKAKHNVLPLSKFCLMEITRQRVRPEINIITSEVCPTCNGTGRTEAPLLFINELHQHLQYLVGNLRLKGIHLTVHPFIAAYLKKGFPSLQFKWQVQLRSRLFIWENAEYALKQFKFENKEREEINLD